MTAAAQPDWSAELAQAEREAAGDPLAACRDAADYASDCRAAALSLLMLADGLEAAHLRADHWREAMAACRTGAGTIRNMVPDLLRLAADMEAE